ncbi:arylsulfotransferase [Halobacteriales archaeon QS_7_69_60]|nr:MAG: arylsulfotransferase [Halobacteriales archaeon QS_7_69_60]
MDLPRVGECSRRTLVRAVVAIVVLALCAPAAYAALDPGGVDLGPGTVEESAETRTYVSVQGFHFAGYGRPKKPARLAAADPDAETAWVFDGDLAGEWFYEVDPLENGNLFVTTTYPDGTIALEYDPEEGVVDRHDVPGLIDTHSTVKVDEDRLLVANMRATEDGVSNDRLFVRNTTTGDVEWEWLFRDHYPNGTDGGFDEDWTHVNDVEFVGDGERYVLASPRNFDQVIVIDRRTDDIVMRLGEDDDYGTLREQHNPDYLEREDGTPVMLVADSENNRVVEYERDCGDADPRLGAGTPPADCEWTLVWSVDGFTWPRDADRLPGGNTLVTDTLNHRVVELTPEGEVVWEFYAAWGPYDAERGAPGSDGPAMADHGTTGQFTVSGGADGSPASRYHVADAISDAGAKTPVTAEVDRVATTYAHVEPWIRPVWMGSWAFLSLVVGLLVGLGWAGAETVTRRDRIAAGVRSRLGRGG